MENFGALWNDLYIHLCLMLSAVIAMDEGEILFKRYLQVGISGRRLMKVRIVFLFVM